MYNGGSSVQTGGALGLVLQIGDVFTLETIKFYKGALQIAPKRVNLKLFDI